MLPRCNCGTYQVQKQNSSLCKNSNLSGWGKSLHPSRSMTFKLRAQRKKILRKEGKLLCNV